MRRGIELGPGFPCFVKERSRRGGGGVFTAEDRYEDTRLWDLFSNLPKSDLVEYQVPRITGHAKIIAKNTDTAIDIRSRILRANLPIT